jgi:carboxypeptidase C (cathepsin A)
MGEQEMGKKRKRLIVESRRKSKPLPLVLVLGGGGGVSSQIVTFFCLGCLSFFLIAGTRIESDTSDTGANES